MRFAELLRSLDWLLIGAVLLLVLIGLAMLFSASYTEAEILSSRFSRQLSAFGFSLLVALLVTRVPYHVIARYALPIYIAGMVGLAVVALLAQVIRGTASRLSLAGFQLQPSEFIKVSLIIALAWLLSRRERIGLPTFLTSGLAVGLPAALILLEPDLGVALLLLALWGGMLVFMGLSWRLIALLGLASAGAFVVGWRWLFAEYQRERVLVFLDPTRDPLGEGYNIVQSIVALGSGRLLGRGLGQGPQSQLQFLPEQHTDFILASIGEELGFVGVTVVIILYAIVLWRLLQIGRRCQDLFGQLLCIGVFLVVLLGVMVSAGMNMGLLPVTGIPLPLVSYGGSNLLSTFLLLGIVQSVHVYSKWVQAPPAEITHVT